MALPGLTTLLALRTAILERTDNVNASFIGACAVTLASSYAFGDVFGVNHSLHRGARSARGFFHAERSIFSISSSASTSGRNR